MGNAKKEIDCLQRLQDKSGSIDEILQFLVEEKLIDGDLVKKVKQSSDEAKEVHAVLSGLSKSDKLQLLEYVWHVLPVEIIKIYIVTNRNNKEFTYNL
jgi:hypothetical protein